MEFDVDAALAAGHSKTDIADFLGREKSFDTEAARKSGYSDCKYLNSYIKLD